jgi:hypothetical protein
MRPALLLLSVLALGCAKAEPPSAPSAADHKVRTPGESMADLPALETGKLDDDYTPTASELPLAEDFAAAAEKRVTPDNYRKELITIQKELEQLAGRR